MCGVSKHYFCSGHFRHYRFMLYVGSVLLELSWEIKVPPVLSLTTVAERRTLSRLLTILDNVHHPLHRTLNRQRSIFNGRLLSLSCSSDRLRKSFVTRAIQLHNATQKGRGRWSSLHESNSVCPPLLISLSIRLLAIHFTGYTLAQT